MEEKDRAEVIKGLRIELEYAQEDYPAFKEKHERFRKAIRMLKEDGDVRRVLEVSGIGYSNYAIWVARRESD